MRPLMLGMLVWFLGKKLRHLALLHQPRSFKLTACTTCIPTLHIHHAQHRVGRQTWPFQAAHVYPSWLWRKRHALHGLRWTDRNRCDERSLYCNDNKSFATSWLLPSHASMCGETPKVAKALIQRRQTMVSSTTYLIVLCPRRMRACYTTTKNLSILRIPFVISCHILEMRSPTAARTRMPIPQSSCLSKGCTT